MKISIITPTFNSEVTISNNVNSILNQTFSNYEHILIDNKSTDNTLKLAIEKYSLNNSTKKLQIITEKDKGIAEAFNKGIKTSNGNIIGILNSDDQFYDEFVLEKVVNCFEGSDRIFVDGNIFFDDAVYGSNVRKPLLCSLTKAMPFNHPTMFFKREVYELYGNYDPEYKFAMDFEFICRLSNQIENLNDRGYYLSGEPIVQMSSGGNSWVNEISTIKETRKALISNDLWNLKAIKNYYFRIIRTRIKLIFSFLGIRYIVKLWRRIKWAN